MKWSLRAVFVSCAALFPAVNSSGFLFQNGSFEDPINFEDGQGWERFGDPDGGAAVGRHDAANGAPGNPAYSQTGDDQYGLAFQTEGAVSGGFYQDVLVEPGASYDFSIQSHHGCNSFGTNGTHASEVLFTWYDGDPEAGGSVISEATHSATPANPGGCDDGFPNAEIDFDWNNWEFANNIAPAGATHLRVTVQWDNQGLAAGGSAWVRWDNAVLTTPLNEDVNMSLDPTDELFVVSFNAQTTLTFSAESSTDLQGWSDFPMPAIQGDGAVHHYYDMPGTPTHSWRVNGSQFGGLLNGDFNETNETGGALHWTTWTVGSAWANHEIPNKLNPERPEYNADLVGVYDGTLQMTVGGFFGDAAGAYQLVPGVAGHTYTLDVDAGVEDWWLPIGEIRMIFLDADETELLWATTNTTDSLYDPDLYDVGVPYQSWSLTATAPALTQWVKVEFADPVGTGSCFFDNAVLTDADAVGPPPPVLPFALGIGQTDSVLISFDGQIGVPYQLEYSEDGGSSWQASLAPLMVGNGTRQSTYDPEGPSTTRTYRIIVPGAP